MVFVSIICCVMYIFVSLYSDINSNCITIEYCIMCITQYLYYEVVSVLLLLFTNVVFLDMMKV